jgi:hypothetical protein
MEIFRTVIVIYLISVRLATPNLDVDETCTCSVIPYANARLEIVYTVPRSHTIIQCPESILTHGSSFLAVKDHTRFTASGQCSGNRLHI